MLVPRKPKNRKHDMAIDRDPRYMIGRFRLPTGVACNCSIVYCPMYEKSSCTALHEVYGYSTFSPYLLKRFWNCIVQLTGTVHRSSKQLRPNRRAYCDMLIPEPDEERTALSCRLRTKSQCAQSTEQFGRRSSLEKASVKGFAYGSQRSLQTYTRR